MKLLTVVVALCVSFVYSKDVLQRLRVTDCGTDPNRSLFVNRYSFSPVPWDITQPGTLSYDISVRNEVPIRTRLDITFRTNVRGPWENLEPSKFVRWWEAYKTGYTYPCTYLLFHNLRWGCPTVLTDAGLSCMCPIEVDRYVLPPTSETLPVPWQGVFLNFPDGDYFAELNLKDEGNANKEVGCLRLEASIKTGNPIPSNWFDTE
ncbi:uncharacterized protein LOC106177757 [Lingula anatina]|uniref:Uncharacterized protein LOC106177757 n=1 Tax=Lingula anatina TaxID=7574 RepID=A0A1S3K1D0_LINAN|nr:uncharacterized protein LOC106177757 [Lingula anatina]|eukprot:XP_013416076.1 uncharacterized protein LOC106177757 [Lingula anatina]